MKLSSALSLLSETVTRSEYCQICLEYTDTFIKKGFLKLPEVLLIYLNYDNGLDTKKKGNIKLEKYLNLESQIVPDSKGAKLNKKRSYKLVSLIQKENNQCKVIVKKGKIDWI